MDFDGDYWSSNAEEACGYGTCWYEIFTVYFYTGSILHSLESAPALVLPVRDP